MRPGSQTLEHAATNVKEELGNSAADLAKVISGANVTTDSVSDTESFVSRGNDVGLSDNRLLVCASWCDRLQSPHLLLIKYHSQF